jgi:hypothetical protein
MVERRAACPELAEGSSPVGRADCLDCFFTTEAQRHKENKQAQKSWVKRSKGSKETQAQKTARLKRPTRKNAGS